MRSGRRRRPGVQRADVHAVGADKPDAVDDNPPRTGGGGDRCGRHAGGGVSVGEHDDHLVVGRGSVKQLDRFGKRVAVVGAAAGSQRIDSVFQCGDRSD